MSNQFSNLPGVNMSVKDGQLLLSSNRTENSMLIIAEAKTNREVPDGPVYVTSEEELKENFGGYFYRGELNPIAAQWVVARKAGVSNVYLMALKSGDKKAQFVDLHDKLFNLMSELSLSHIVLDGLYADEEVEGITAEDFGVDSFEEIDSVPARFVHRATAVPVPAEEPKVLTVTVGGDSVDITVPNTTIDIAALDKALQEALRLNGLDAKISITAEAKKVVVTSSTEIGLSGADALAALSLTDVSSQLEGYGSAAVLLSNYAERISNEVGSTIAYIGVKPATSIDLAGIKKHFEGLMKQENQISPYLQVVAGPQVGISLPGSLHTQWVTGVTQYASLISTLAPQNAPTNQPLPGVVALRYNLSPRQLNDLTGKKYVTFRVKNGQIRVVDGVTTAPDLTVGQDVVKSDFTRLSTLRITNYMVTEIREACDTFIGMPNEFANYNAMNTAIKSVIDQAIDHGVIQDARYSIRLGQELHASEIELTILPQFELRTINVTVGLTTPDNF